MEPTPKAKKAKVEKTEVKEEEMEEDEFDLTEAQHLGSRFVCCVLHGRSIQTCFRSFTGTLCIQRTHHGALQGCIHHLAAARHVFM